MSKGLKGMTEEERKETIKRRLAEQKGGLGYLAAKAAEALLKKKKKKEDK